MPELKHGFGAAKMNKDADERTVPNGEYREALNVQIVTSDGSDVGTLQTLLGNTKISSSDFQATLDADRARCVGSVADEANNKIYYFVYDGVNSTDYIFQYDINSGDLIPIVVDKYQVDVVTSLNYGGASNTRFAISAFNEPASNNVTNIRPGMTLTGPLGNPNAPTWIGFADNIKVISMKYITTGNTAGDWEIYLDDFSGNNIFFNGSIATITGTNLQLHADRVLNFRELEPNGKEYKITGINIIDDTIYWTDGFSEPKKINISNVETDSSGLYHSKFLVKDNYGVPISFQPANKIDFRENPDYLKEEHVTVIKKSPLYPPTLLLSNTANFRFNSGSASVLDSSISTYFVDQDDSPISVGSVKNVSFGNFPDYQIGDLILMSRTNDFINQEDFGDFEVIGEILEYNNSTGDVKLKITYLSNEIGGTFGTNETFNCVLKQEKALYEFKFPRFAYRYKYQDDQYSTYSPFSEVAFLPGKFNYKPKDGYNLGMVNTLRSLYIMDFVPDQDALPKDVVAIDIVYKESNSNNVYIVETIEYGDDEWVARGSDINTAAGNYARTKGALLVTSEMVKAAIASNQLLRPWDNVPRKAKAQDMVGNRIVYANYVQNYNLN